MSWPQCVIAAHSRPQTLCASSRERLAIFLPGLLTHAFACSVSSCLELLADIFLQEKLSASFETQRGFLVSSQQLWRKPLSRLLPGPGLSDIPGNKCVAMTSSQDLAMVQPSLFTGPHPSPRAAQWQGLLSACPSLRYDRWAAHNNTRLSNKSTAFL